MEGPPGRGGAGLYGDGEASAGTLEEGDDGRCGDLVLVFGLGGFGFDRGEGGGILNLELEGF